MDSVTGSCCNYDELLGLVVRER